ncbi:MAG: translation elongation factor Ts [Patescibacteria group bacterium]
MYSPSIEQIKELRQATLAPMMKCKEALVASAGDFEKAVAWLNEKGAIKAAAKSERSVGAGLINAYIHNGGQVGVLLDLRCETDFVARNQEFKDLAHEICLQIAAASPRWVSSETVPEDEIKEKKQAWLKEAEALGKPKEVAEKIVQGKLDSFYKETCLLNQPHFKNEEETINDLIVKTVAKLGENIKVGKFVRFEI